MTLLEAAQLYAKFITWPALDPRPMYYYVRPQYLIPAVFFRVNLLDVNLLDRRRIGLIRLAEARPQGSARCWGEHNRSAQHRREYRRIARRTP